MSEASKIVSGALLGTDFRTVIVAGKAYVIKPPTIHRIAGAAAHLGAFEGIQSTADALRSLQDITETATALSFFISGDDTLTAQLAQGTLPEVVAALEAALSLIDVANFSTLSVLTRNVSRLTARQRQ